MKVLYLSNQGGDAGDRHLQALHAAGYDVAVPGLPDAFAEAVGAVRRIAARLDPAVVVACGRGAAVALAAGLGRPLVVLAAGGLPPQAFVLHAGPDDPLLAALLQAMQIEQVARFACTAGRRLVTLGVDLEGERLQNC